MPDWTKVLTLIVGLGVWTAVVAATLLQGKLPDAATLGIPAALWIVLAPPIRIGRGRGQDDQGRDAAADGEAVDA